MSTPPAPPLPDPLQLFEHLADAVYLIDPETSRIVWCNRAGWTDLGLQRDDVLQHSVLSLQADVHNLPQWAQIAEAVRAVPRYRFIGHHRHRDGHQVPVEVLTTRLHHQGREYFLSVARDIGPRLLQETAAAQPEQRLWFALNEASDGLWDWDIAAGRAFFSPQMKRMLGFGPDELPPEPAAWTGRLHPDDAAAVRAALDEHLDGRQPRYEAEFRVRHRSGSYLWVHDRGLVCSRDAAGRPTRMLGMLQDISARKALEDQLRAQAALDALTGLPNRREGMRWLQAQHGLCRRLGRPLALVFIDIDHFKAVNDGHGHLVGDHVLQQVARLLQRTVRASDLVCRWGGEEFLLVAPDTALPAAGRLADKLRRAVRQAPADDAPPVSISLGVAASHDGEDLAALIARADAALYRAKADGRDRVALDGGDAAGAPPG